MRRVLSVWLVAGMSVMLVAGCAKRQVRGFYNKAYRQAYAMTEEELKGMQFYLSKDVLVRASPASQVAGQTVLRVPKGTKGLVVDSGPDWLRVSFDEEGSGVQFVTDESRAEDLFWFATTVPGEPGLHKIRDLPDKILMLDGQRLMVIHGDDAHLLVDKKDLERLIETRSALQGRKIKR